MSVIIVNVSPEGTSLDGMNDYELRINTVVLARFMHERRRGLSVCLRQAAAAYDEAVREDRTSAAEHLRWINTLGVEREPFMTHPTPPASSAIEGEPPEVTFLRNVLTKRATSAEFNEWHAREVVAYIDRLRAARPAGGRTEFDPGVTNAAEKEELFGEKKP